jgi:RNA polymerase sigma-70 factor (ECF subfamily)
MTAIEFTHQVAGMRTTLRQFTSRFTRDRDESLDLVQDTILKALTYKDKFRADTNLKGWLFTIMRNTFINSYRRRKRTKTSRDSSNDLYCLSVEESHTFNRPAENPVCCFMKLPIDWPAVCNSRFKHR